MIISDDILSKVLLVWICVAIGSSAVLYMLRMSAWEDDVSYGGVIFGAIISGVIFTGLILLDSGPITIEYHKKEVEQQNEKVSESNVIEHELEDGSKILIIKGEDGKQEVIEVPN